jgi:hypothetical protein
VFGVREVLLVGGCLGLLGVLAGLFGHTQRQWTEGGTGAGAAVSVVELGRQGGLVLGTCVLLAGLPNLYDFGLVDKETDIVLNGIKRSQLNKRDAAVANQGYYENLTQADRFNPALFQLMERVGPVGEKLTQTNVCRMTNDFRVRELNPLVSLEFQGHVYTINSDGMRDREYSIDKPAGTFRIVHIGSSVALGSGVNVEETYQSLVEEMLNNSSDGSVYKSYEILNFAVPAYGPIEKLMLFEDKSLKYTPDLLLFGGELTDGKRATDKIVSAVREGKPLPYEYLTGLAKQAGVTRTTFEDMAKVRMEAHSQEILSWVYGRLVATCREKGIEPVWVYVSIPEDEVLDPQEIEARADELVRLARGAGMTTIDMRRLFRDTPMERVRVREDDHHPNALGHRMIADRLYKELTGNPVLKRYWPEGQDKPLSGVSSERGDGTEMSKSISME